MADWGLDCQGIRGACAHGEFGSGVSQIEAALTHTRPKRKRPRVLDGAGEARLVQLAVMDRSSRCRCWPISWSTIRGGRAYFTRNGADDAQKNELKPWLKDAWCIPETASAEFVCAMEDTLEVYHRQQDPKRPVVCLDEGSKQLTRESRLPLPPPTNSTSNLFLLFAPLQAWRHVKVTARRTMVDTACVTLSTSISRRQNDRPI